jgi:ABC-type branched-subunit amino acid transport system ATPase component
MGAQGDGPLSDRRPDDAILDVRDLRKAFGGVHAVDGCTFAVPRGKYSGLICPNGSGKTTTFKILNGLAAPDGGQVLYS